MKSLLSKAYMCMASASWRLLLTQAVRLAFSFALAKAGNNNPARIAMMAMTTRSSIKVKAPSNLVLPGHQLLFLEPVIETVVQSFFGNKRSKFPLWRISKDAVRRDSGGVGISRCDVRAACSGATPSIAGDLW